MSRAKHDAGDCWTGCQYCIWEDAQARDEAAADVDAIAIEHRTETGCTGVPADATGVCTGCGDDLLGYYDDEDLANVS